MNTIIFSIYDSGCRSSALFLNDKDTAVTKDTYFDKVACADELKDYTDEDLFNYFEIIFGEDIHRIVIIENGEIYRIRYNGKRFPDEKRAFFGYDVRDKMFIPYVSENFLYKKTV